jgi:hypothetical protein
MEGAVRMIAFIGFLAIVTLAVYLNRRWRREQGKGDPGPSGPSGGRGPSGPPDDLPPMPPGSVVPGRIPDEWYTLVEEVRARFIPKKKEHEDADETADDEMP